MALILFGRTNTKLTALTGIFRLYLLPHQSLTKTHPFHPHSPMLSLVTANQRDPRRYTKRCPTESTGRPRLTRKCPATIRPPLPQLPALAHRRLPGKSTIASPAHAPTQGRPAVPGCPPIRVPQTPPHFRHPHPQPIPKQTTSPLFHRTKNFQNLRHPPPIQGGGAGTNSIPQRPRVWPASQCTRRQGSTITRWQPPIGSCILGAISASQKKV